MFLSVLIAADSPFVLMYSLPEPRTLDVVVSGPWTAMILDVVKVKSVSKGSLPDNLS